MKDKNVLFRKEALEEITNPEHLNQLIQVTSKKSWIFLFTLSALLLSVVLWSIFGTVTQRIKGQGIILAMKGSLYNAVAPEGEAQIIQIAVKLGDEVKRDDIIAYLLRPNLENQVVITEKYLETLKAKYQQLSVSSKEEIAQRQKNLAEQNKILQRIITEQKQNLIHIDDLLRTRQIYLQKGLVTKQDVVATLQDLYRTKSQIENAREQTIQNRINESTFIDEWRERLRQLDLTIREKQKELDNLKAQLKLSHHVYSPITGVVTGIQAQVGDVVKTGMPVASISTINKGLDAITYIPLEDGKRVKTEMVALVTPSTIKKEEFGSIVGRVVSVGQYPSTSNSMMATLQNPDLVKKFIKEQPPIEIRVHLLTDSQTYSGLKWTSSKGPHQYITPGTFVETRINVRQQRPISLILPALKKLLGE